MAVIAAALFAVSPYLIAKEWNACNRGGVHILQLGPTVATGSFPSEAVGHSPSANDN